MTHLCFLSDSTLEVQRIGRGPSVYRKALLVFLAAIVLTHTLSITFTDFLKLILHRLAK